MNDHRAFRYDLAGHLSANLNAFDLEPPEEMHVRLAVDDNVFRDQAARNLAYIIDRGRADALHVAAHFSFDQRGAAGHGGAAQVALRRDMNLALSFDRAAEARGDLVIPQVDMRAAFRAEARGGRRTDFMFRLAVEALDLGVVVLGPKPFDLLAQRRIGRGAGLDALFLRPHPNLLFRDGGREVRAALAAHRALR